MPLSRCGCELSARKHRYLPSKYSSTSTFGGLLLACLWLCSLLSVAAKLTRVIVLNSFIVQLTEVENLCMYMHTQNHINGHNRPMLVSLRYLCNYLSMDRYLFLLPFLMSLCIHIHTNLHIYTYIHTYIHTCIYTYRHTHIHTYKQTYIHTYVRTYIYTDIHTYIYTYIHACMHAYIHTYIHTYIHAYIHTCIHTYIHILM